MSAERRAIAARSDSSSAVVAVICAPLCPLTSSRAGSVQDSAHREIQDWRVTPSQCRALTASAGA